MILYSFHIDHPFEEAFQMLLDTANSIGKTRVVRKDLGHFFWKSGFLQIEEFYVQKTNPSACNVQMVFKPSSNDYGDKFRSKRVSYDKIADKFYHALMERYPKEDFGISTGSTLYVVQAKILTDGHETRYITSSHRTPSIGGALLGGMAFGMSGAIVGGMSGRTQSNTRTEFVRTDRVYVQAVLSNGRYTEGWLKTDSLVYRYISVNMLQC